jgi:DNA-binding transcriptional LysR family regulator
MAEVKKIGNHVYRRLTDEEARREFGSSFVFVGQAKPTDEARELLKEANAALEQLQEIRKAKGAEQP